MRAKLLRGCAIGAIISAVIALPVTPIASLALIGTFFVTGLVHVSQLRFPFPAAYCWWIYARWYALDPRFTLKLILTFGIPFALMWLPIGIALYRRSPPSFEACHARPAGNRTRPSAVKTPWRCATWMTMEEATTLFPGPHPVWGGIPVGEAYRPDEDETVNAPFR